MSAGFVLACFWPEHAYPLQSAANLFLTVNVVLVWARIQEDVLDPLRERHERRRRAFEEWLARRDARLLEPRRRSGRPDAPPE
jgi:serine/threonine-protein kinase